MMQRAALAIAEHAAKSKMRVSPAASSFAGEFRRGPQVKRRPLPPGADQVGGEGMQMGLVAGRDLQGRGFHLDEILAPEPGPYGGRDAAPP